VQGAADVPLSRMSKKARIAAKKAAKQAKRGAASDDEDLGPGKSGASFIVVLNIYTSCRAMECWQ